jgi:hypothetical protein
LNIDGGILLALDRQAVVRTGRPPDVDDRRLNLPVASVDGGGKLKEGTAGGVIVKSTPSTVSVRSVAEVMDSENGSVTTGRLSRLRVRLRAPRLRTSRV